MLKLLCSLDNRLYALCINNFELFVILYYSSCNSIVLIFVYLSVIVGSGFNPIGLTRPTLTLGSGKFPSSTGWGERRMRVECSTQPTRSRDVT